MKKEFVEFLLKRIGRKADDMHNAGSAEELTQHYEDIEEYIDTLKDVISAVIEP